MKLCYKGLKEIGIDVDEIWRKMLDLRVSIGLIEKVHLDDFGFVCSNICSICNISLTLIISIETCKEVQLN